MRGALVVDGVVKNVIAYDSGYTPASGTLVPLEDTAVLSIGWSWDGVEFAAPSVDINILKDAKYAAIDARTDAIIDSGFTYSGKQFSLSLAAQAKMLGAYAIKDIITYPLRWNTNLDDDAINIADATGVSAFFLTATASYRAQLDAGTVLKDAVRTATTVAEVNAVIDNR